MSLELSAHFLGRKVCFSKIIYKIYTTRHGLLSFRVSRPGHFEVKRGEDM